MNKPKQQTGNPAGNAKVVPTKNPQFKDFANLASKVVAVPKSEIDAKRGKKEA